MELIDRTNLTEQTKLRLDKISEIENYFYEDINQRKSCSKKLSKNVAAFDYIDKFLIFFKCNKRWGIYLFVYRYYCCTSWKCTCKFYFNFFPNNRNN